MAVKFSQGLRDKLCGLQATVKGACCGTADTLTLVDGGASADTITRASGSFLTDGFIPGQVLHLSGATTSANDTAVTGVLITSVVALTITVETGVVNTGEVFAATTILASAEGGSLKDIMRDGVLWIYSGSQPSDADQAMTGTQLVKITTASGAFAHGAFANGLEFDAATGGYIEKCSEEVWSGVGLAAGTAGYFVLVANPTDSLGASTSLPRIMGSIGTSGADLNLATTTIAVGNTLTIDTFKLTLPAYYGA